jgi:cbb3-type cytochrome c oxidase subunit II
MASSLHRRLEGWPFVFTILTVLAILVGTVVEFAPLFLVGDAMKPLPSVEPFTPLEVAGRDVYIKEGCVGCHSQMVRPFRHELERYGPATAAGETVYEHPFLWGSKRTGPDLQRVGGKYPHLWHVRHMEDPRSTSPRSIMPPYPWLLDKPTDYAAIPSKVRALSRVGVPYTEGEIVRSAEHAQAQAAEIANDIVAQGGPEGLADKEIVALIAFLQRLGVDGRQDLPSPALPPLEPADAAESQATASL